MEKKCQHWINEKFEECGKPAVAAVEAQRGRMVVEGKQKGDMGRGTASMWITVCKKHVKAYPDHNGFMFDEVKH